MLVNNIDRLVNSNCGFSCGYIMDGSPTYFNPLDALLQALSAHREHFYGIQLFLDTIFFSALLLYTFVCILYGIVKIGINFFSLEIYRIKRRDTMPQALSIVSILVILMMFAFSMQLMSIAPTYVTFGDQRVGAQSAACSLRDTKHFALDDMIKVHIGCHMTMISELYMKIQLSVPLFSIIYFILSWTFLICFCFFMVYHAFFKKYYQSHHLPGYSPLGQDDEEEQDEDLQRFMKGSSSNSGLHQRIIGDKMANMQA